MFTNNSQTNQNMTKQRGYGISDRIIQIIKTSFLSRYRRDPANYRDFALQLSAMETETRVNIMIISKA